VRIRERKTPGVTLQKVRMKARNAWPAAAAASDRFHFLAACVISNFERISFVLFL